MSLSFVTDM